jgi:hypothetical protein
MRRQLFIDVLFLIACVPFASAQPTVTFPGTPQLPGMSAPVAFPGPVDPGSRVSSPIRTETGVEPARSNPLEPRRLSHPSSLCKPLNLVGAPSITGAYFGVSRVHWSLRELSRDANAQGDVETWHRLFVPISSFTPMSQARPWFNAAPSVLCLPH